MATYYVRSSGGNDGNTGLSFALGWATIQFAADTAVAGDLVLICADGTHLPTATIDIDINTGTDASRITFRGAAADGTDNGTVATISGASLGSGYIVNVAANTVDYVTVENLRFTGGPSTGFYHRNGAGNWLWHWSMPCAVGASCGRCGQGLWA